MPIKQTRVALNTTTGTQDITISGIGTPKAAMVILQNASTDDTNTVNATTGIGFTDGTRGVHSWINSRNGQVASSTRRRTGAANWGFSYNPSGFVVTSFDFQAWITDGVRINITSANGDDCFATFVFFYGSDITNVYCDLVQLTGTSINVTAPNFEPDLVIVAGNGDATKDSRDVHAIQSYGFAINDGSDTNAGLFYYDENAQTTTDNGVYVSSTASSGQYFNGTLSYQTTVDTFDSQGFTFSSTASPGNDYVIYLAIEFNALDLSLTVEDSPAATGAYSINAGFTPQFSMLLASRTTAINTGDTTDAGQFTLYTVDGTNDYSAVYSSEDGSVGSDTDTRSSSGKIVTLDNTAAVENEGTFTSFTGTGPSFNFTTVGASQYKWVHLSVEAASTGITVTGATPSYSYAAVNGTVDLTGIIDVTGATPTYSYSAVAGIVDLTAEITVTGATTSYSYTAVNGVIELGQEINVVGTTPSYSYTAVQGSVLLQGAIDVTGQTPNYSYTAISASVQVGELDFAVNFSGIIKQSAFEGSIKSPEFTGTVKTASFSGTIKQSNFSGVRK